MASLRPKGGCHGLGRSFPPPIDAGPVSPSAAGSGDGRVLRVASVSRFLAACNTPSTPEGISFQPLSSTPSNQRLFREWRQAMQNGLSTSICRVVAAETRIGEDTSVHRSRFATSWSILSERGLVVVTSPPSAPYEKLLQEYLDYLKGNRYLADTTIKQHARYLTPFLEELGVASVECLCKLSPEQVLALFTKHAQDRGTSLRRCLQGVCVCSFASVSSKGTCSATWQR